MLGASELRPYYDQAIARSLVYSSCMHALYVSTLYFQDPIYNLFQFYNVITVFSNAVSKSINIYTEEISEGGEGNIQKCSRHCTCDAPQKTTI